MLKFINYGSTNMNEVIVDNIRFLYWGDKLVACYLPSSDAKAARYLFSTARNRNADSFARKWANTSINDFIEVSQESLELRQELAHV